MNTSKSLAGQASFGIDIGHSSTKIVVAMLDNPTKRDHSVISTVVIPAMRITDENTAKLAARETVTLDGSSYFFGETAVLQGNATVFSGQERDWVATKTHDVLLIGAWKKAMGLIKCRPKSVNLVLGLPMAFYSAQKKALKARAEELLTPYLLQGQTVRILLRPQSLAPLINLQHLNDGRPNPKYDVAEESWAVIDVGHYTTDFAILLRTQIRDVAGDSISGVSIVYSAVTAEFQDKGYPVVLESIVEAINTKKIRHYGIIDVSEIVDVATQPLRQVIVDRAKTLFGDVAGRLNGVIVAGGGATLVFDAVKETFGNAILDASPRLSVAEGMCRWGLYAHWSSADDGQTAAAD